MMVAEALVSRYDDPYYYGSRNRYTPFGDAWDDRSRREAEQRRVEEEMMRQQQMSRAIIKPLQHQTWEDYDGEPIRVGYKYVVHDPDADLKWKTVQVMSTSDAGINVRDVKRGEVQADSYLLGRNPDRKLISTSKSPLGRIPTLAEFEETHKRQMHNLSTKDREKHVRLLARKFARVAVSQLKFEQVVDILARARTIDLDILDQKALLTVLDYNHMSDALTDVHVSCHGQHGTRATVYADISQGPLDHKVYSHVTMQELRRRWMIETGEKWDKKQAIAALASTRQQPMSITIDPSFKVDTHIDSEAFAKELQRAATKRKATNQKKKTDMSENTVINKVTNATSEAVSSTGRALFHGVQIGGADAANNAFQDFGGKLLDLMGMKPQFLDTEIGRQFAKVTLPFLVEIAVRASQRVDGTNPIPQAGLILKGCGLAQQANGVNVIRPLLAVAGPALGKLAEELKAAGIEEDPAPTEADLEPKQTEANTH